MNIHSLHTRDSFHNTNSSLQVDSEVPAATVRQALNHSSAPRPNNPHQAPKRVLLAVEDSPHSDLALAWCLDNALTPQVRTGPLPERAMCGLSVKV